MPAARNLALLTSRAVLGSYLAAHGAQKLFGSFDGPGIDAAAAGFHHIGLRPGSIFATRRVRLRTGRRRPDRDRRRRPARTDHPGRHHGRRFFHPPDQWALQPRKAATNSL